MLAFVTLTDRTSGKPVDYAVQHIIRIRPSEKGTPIQTTNGSTYDVTEPTDVIRDLINQAIYSVALTMRTD